MQPTSHVILFLAANPRDTAPLALDVEARAIHEELRGRARFRFETRWATQPIDLLREVRALRPTIVHFSGHGAPQAPSGARDGASQGGDARRDECAEIGGPGARVGAGARVDRAEITPAPTHDVVSAGASDGVPRNLGARPDSALGSGATSGPASRDSGLILQGALGAQWVSGEAVAQALGAAGASVKLVVLNACFTEAMSDALLAHVDCVVGISGPLHDDAARHFAVGFYGGLGEAQSIAAAVEQGRANIELEGFDGSRVRLVVRDGADRRVLAATVPERRRELPCPFPGMRPYTAEEAARFRGRDAEVTELIARLRAGEREIYVIGPSGSGKSSLVASGVVPELARASELGRYVVRALRPGEQPSRRLHDALGGGSVAQLLAAHGEARLLLVIDQLEELFTLASADEQAGFLAALRDVRAEPRAAVIIALRADFYGALMESPLWPGHAKLSRIEVGPLRGDALGDAIATPAREAGVAVEPALLERLLADAAAEPGALPLLQETLVQLWDRRADQALTIADYAAIGDDGRSGLAVALARRADATLRQLSTAQAAIARRIALRLISFGEGRSDTRRQQPRSQLRAAGDDGFELVLQAMVDARLLTVDDSAGEPRVDLAHEVMITAWPALADWIRTHRADEQRRRRLEDAAEQWAAHGRGERGLLDAHELVDAAQWQGTESGAQLGHSANVVALVTASRTALHRVRRYRRLQRALIGLIGFVVIAIATWAITADRDRDKARVHELQARIQALIAHLQSLKSEASDRENKELVARSFLESGRQLVVDKRYEEAVPYLRAALVRGLDSAALRTMFAEAAAQLPATRDHAKAAAQPSAARAKVGALDSAAEHAAPDRPHAVALDGDVGHAAPDVAHADDGSGHAPLDVAHPLAPLGPTDAHAVAAHGFSAACIDPEPANAGSRLVPAGASVNCDGTRALTIDDTSASLWDAHTGARIAILAHRGKVRAAVFSPDGARVATASADNTAQIWDARTGAPLTDPLAHTNNVWSVAFSPDGALLVTASSDRSARLWDVLSGRLIRAPFAHDASVRTASFSPDGTRVRTVGYDKTVYVWNVDRDAGSLAEWAAAAARSAYVLNDQGVLVHRR